MCVEVWKIVSPHFWAPLTSQTSHSLQAAEITKFMMSLWKTKEAMDSCICLTSCLSFALLTCCFGNKSKCSIFELNSKCHSCPFSHLDQTARSDSAWGESTAEEAPVKSHKWSIRLRLGPICTVKWLGKCRYYICEGQGITASRGFQWSILVEKMPNSTHVSVERGRMT